MTGTSRYRFRFRCRADVMDGYLGWSTEVPREGASGEVCCVKVGDKGERRKGLNLDMQLKGGRVDWSDVVVVKLDALAMLLWQRGRMSVKQWKDVAASCHG